MSDKLIEQFRETTRHITLAYVAVASTVIMSLAAADFISSLENSDYKSPEQINSEKLIELRKVNDFDVDGETFDIRDDFTESAKKVIEIGDYPLKEVINHALMQLDEEGQKAFFDNLGDYKFSSSTSSTRKKQGEKYFLIDHENKEINVALECFRNNDAHNGRISAMIYAIKDGGFLRSGGSSNIKAPNPKS